MFSTTYSPSRSPVGFALLVLVVIWTVWLIAGPSGISPQSLDSSIKVITPGKVSSDGSDGTSRGEAGTESSSSKNPKGHLKDKPLILYAYSETPNARRNLEYFIAHGLHATADFVFILNGETNASWLLPNRTNIHHVSRPNDCYDLGAYAEVLQKDDLYKKYKRFIMLNASIRGPFMPYWAQTCWSDMYLNRVTDEVKLFGMTGNCWPQFHVQSMIWATDSVGLNLLLFPPQPDPLPTPTPTPSAEDPEVTIITKPFIEKGINDCFHSWDTAVHAEIGATSIIQQAGYKASVMMTAFHADADFIEHCDSTVNGDVLWNGKYFGANVHPYETIFLKTNRDIDPVLMNKLTEWHDEGNYSSYDFC